MFGAEANCTPTWVQAQSPIASRNGISTKTRICFLKKNPNPSVKLGKAQFSFALSHSTLHSTLQRSNSSHAHFSLNASSASGIDITAVGSAECMEEPATKVAFQTTLNLPGCSNSLSLLGTGFREKVFAIIGVKVYAAGLYVNPSVLGNLESYKGRSASEILEDSSIFSSIFQAPLEKSLQIVLVRDVDGKTFWDALDDAISPRIKSSTSIDEAALSTFRSTFRERPLKKGTFIFLTWLDPSKMNVCVSSDGIIPSGVDATIESGNVASALFDVFLGDAPVSPSLKASVVDGLATNLK